VLKHGFRWVSCRYDRANVTDDVSFVLGSPERDLPYTYPTGLVEIPFQGYTDRSFFETVKNVVPQEYDTWRAQHGARVPVPAGWRAPWTAPGALDEWIDYQLRAIDYAYERRLLWLPGWHPTSHYLHDPHNTMLRRFLEHCRAKPEPILVCTLRDVPALLREDAASPSATSAT
jgi:hypothetical protein